MIARHLGLMIGTATMLVASVANAQNESNLQRRVSIDVNAVAPRQVLEMIARAVDCTVVVDPKVAEPVTIRVSSVTARTALNVVCESVGCRWQLDGRTLKVDAEAPASASPAETSERAGEAPPEQTAPVRRASLLVGDGVTAPVSTNYVRPLYPRAAMRSKVQGQVDVEFVVLRDGTVGEVRVTRSTFT